MEQATHIPTPTRSRKRLIAAVVAVAAAGAAAIGVQRCVDTTRHSTRQTLCVHNLKFIAMGLKMYADEHGGRFPERLSELWPKYLTEPEVFVCPEVQAACMRGRGVPHPFPPNPPQDVIKALSSYAYVPGHTARDAADTVIVYEKRDNHFGKGRSLLYLDGHGAWEPPENWRNGPPNKTLPPGF